MQCPLTNISFSFIRTKWKYSTIVGVFGDEKRVRVKDGDREKKRMKERVR